MPLHVHPRDVAIASLCGVIGLVAWIAFQASAPRYSHFPDEDFGNLGAYVAVVVVAAFMGGLLVPRSTGVVGLALGLPGLALSPFTAPRGDNDGLWTLIVPELVVLSAALVAVALGGGWLRSWLTHGRPNRPVM